VSVAQALIARHGLQPHPEGGWYRETWRAETEPGARSAGTAILFLLEQGQGSHWHKVDAAELWFWHAGAPLDLRIGDTTVMLDAANPQALVPAGNGRRRGRARAGLSFRAWWCRVSTSRALPWRRRDGSLIASHSC